MKQTNNIPPKKITILLGFKTVEVIPFIWNEKKEALRRDTQEIRFDKNIQKPSLN